MEIIKSSSSSKDDLLKTFKTAKVGDVVAVVYSNDATQTLLLALRNIDNHEKTITFYNPESGYVWRDGGTTNEEVFDKFFVGANYQSKIKELKVYKSSTLILK